MLRPSAAGRDPRNGVELTAKEWLRIAEEAKAAGTTWLCVTGGEPLLHPEFPQIWERLSEMGFFLTLQTNASLIRGKVLNLLERCPPRQVKITLYGSDDDVYRAVCSVEKGFTQVNEGIHNLMSLGIPITLVSTIIRQNESDVKRMAFYAYRHRLPWLATGGIKPSLRGASTDALSVAVTEKLEEQKQKEIEARLREGRFFDPKRKPASYCRDYRLGYWVVWNGMMRFCSFMNEPNIPVRNLPSKKPGGSCWTTRKPWTGRKSAKAVRRRKRVKDVLLLLSSAKDRECDYIFYTKIKI